MRCIKKIRMLLKIALPLVLIAAFNAHAGKAESTPVVVDNCGVRLQHFHAQDRTPMPLEEAEAILEGAYPHSLRRLYFASELAPYMSEVQVQIDKVEADILMLESMSEEQMVRSESHDLPSDKRLEHQQLAWLLVALKRIKMHIEGHSEN
jgi:hypothetical protein